MRQITLLESPAHSKDSYTRLSQLFANGTLGLNSRLSKCYGRIDNSIFIPFVTPWSKLNNQHNLPISFQDYSQIGYNQVFTEFCLTNKYYFRAKSSQGLGYTTFSYTHSKLIIDPTPRTTESVNISAIVDDTNCVSDSQSNLEQILAIAQGFYGFTNIIVNHSKAMVRSNSLDYRSRHHIAH